MTLDPSYLLPISHRTISPDLPSATDVYLLTAETHTPELFCAEGMPPGAARLNELASRPDAMLYMRADGRLAYQEYLRENWCDLIHAPARSCNRVGTLGDIVRATLRDVFRGGDTETIVGAARHLSDCICDVLEGQTAPANELYAVLQHDYAGFTHSTNVSLYCVILARELGFSRTEQREIAIGGLLHDIGKLDIDANLLNKTGQLTKLQYREIMQHPTLGFQRLVDRNDISFGQLMMVYQHHERLDGSGYPTSVVADEIHQWARVCAIVDAYEALTTHRPYRQGASPEVAVELLAKARGAFDSDMLSCWERLICQTV